MTKTSVINALSQVLYRYILLYINIICKYIKVYIVVVFCIFQAFTKQNNTYVNQ